LVAEALRTLPTDRIVSVIRRGGFTWIRKRRIGMARRSHHVADLEKLGNVTTASEKEDKQEANT
jgi:hypothetical protein